MQGGATGSGGRRIALRRSLDRLSDSARLPAIQRRAAELWRRIGLTRTGQVALVVAVVPWIAARVVAGTTLYVLAYGIVGVVLSAAFLAPRRLKLTAERTGLFPRAQQGDRIEVVVTVAAERALSSFQIEERVPPKLGAALRVPVAKVSPGQVFTYSYSLQCARRGAYTVGPLVAVTQDPIGVAQRETVLAEPFELLVHPRVARVADRPLTRLYEDPPIRPPVSRPWPSGMEFYGMREFRPGDDLRRIVWRASARTGTLMVSEAEQGITDHITLVLDTDRGSHSRDGDVSESFEYAVSICASLAVRHLAEGYEVRIESNAGALTRPLRGPEKSLMLLDVMARVDEDRLPLAGVLRRLVADPRRDAHTVVVTPHVGPVEAGMLKLLVDKGVSVTVVAVVRDDSEAESFAACSAVGCLVAPVRVGDDLAAALAHDQRVGRRA